MNYLDRFVIYLLKLMGAYREEDKFVATLLKTGFLQIAVINTCFYIGVFLFYEIFGG